MTQSDETVKSAAERRKELLTTIEILRESDSNLKTCVSYIETALNYERRMSGLKPITQFEVLHIVLERMTDHLADVEEINYIKENYR